MHCSPLFLAAEQCLHRSEEFSLWLISRKSSIPQTGILPDLTGQPHSEVFLWCHRRRVGFAGSHTATSQSLLSMQSDDALSDGYYRLPARGTSLSDSYDR
jgi:hypothetical protein